MGRIDEFLRAHVAAGLTHGEQVLGFAHARQPQRFNVAGVPQLYVHWLAVATSWRLIFFRTEVRGIFEGSLEPVAMDTVIWSYDEIARVEIGAIEGLNIHSGGQG